MFFSLRTLVCCSADKMCPHSKHRYWPTSSPYLKLRPDEPPVVFVCRVPQYSDDGMYPYSGDNSVDRYPPHEKTTPLMGLVAHWRYHIVDKVKHPILDRRIQPFNGLYPYFKPIFAGITGLWLYTKLCITMRISLFGLSPRCIGFIWS